MYFDKMNIKIVNSFQNYKRVVETWFDDKYKEFFYTREPLAQLLDHGDISEQLEFKRRKRCKSFQWYMENVAYDVFDKFPELPPNIHWGEVRKIIFILKILLYILFNSLLIIISLFSITFYHYFIIAIIILIFKKIFILVYTQLASYQYK